MPDSRLQFYEWLAGLREGTLEGVALLDGVDVCVVRATFFAVEAELTPDGTAMYAQTGGMQEFDNAGWRLWSLDEVKEGNAEKSPLGVYFADYLIDCWRYLLVPRGSISAVYRDNFDGNAPYQVAPSLEAFFAGYLRDPVSVLESTAAPDERSNSSPRRWLPRIWAQLRDVCFWRAS